LTEVAKNFDSDRPLEKRYCCSVRESWLTKVVEDFDWDQTLEKRHRSIRESSLMEVAKNFD
jgi:hypothetical protein